MQWCKTNGDKTLFLIPTHEGKFHHGVTLYGNHCGIVTFPSLKMFGWML